MANVASMNFQQRLGEVFQRTLPKLAPEARTQLAALITPESLAIISGVLVAWVVGHAFGYGEAIDIVIGVVGFAAIGLSVFTGIDELYLFARETYSATGDSDLDQAAGHLARAIAILGIQAVLALLFKGRPKGGRVPAGPEPTGPGFRYKPTIIKTPALAAGEGSTTFWGDVEISTAGSPTDQAIVLLHEKLHQSLSPKFYLLRRFRVENRIGSYFRSSLYRYVEEALAETIGQVGVNGLSKTFVGLRFPVTNGYVYLTRAGGYSSAMRGAGLVPETASLLATGAVQGFAFKIWFKPDVPKPSAQK
jgi:hypothetical protein